MSRPGTVTRWVQEIARGSDSAAASLWNFYRKRMLRKAKVDMDRAEVKSQEPDDVASQVFAEFVLWLRDSASVYKDRRSIWSQITQSMWLRSLRIRQHENRHKRIKIWELSEPTDVDEHHESVAYEFELVEELIVGTEKIHPRAPEIMQCLLDGLDVPTITQKLGMKLRTVYRVVYNCRIHMESHCHV